MRGIEFSNGAVTIKACTTQADALASDVAGAEKIMLGSDHPFPIGDPEPLRIIDEARLDPAERQAILGDTAARLFHVSCDCAE